jgi:hypothetical protein
MFEPLLLLTRVSYFGEEPDVVLLSVVLPLLVVPAGVLVLIEPDVVFVELLAFGMLPPLFVGVCELMPLLVLTEPLVLAPLFMLLPIEPELIEPELVEPELIEDDDVAPGLLSCC